MTGKRNFNHCINEFEGRLNMGQCHLGTFCVTAEVPPQFLYFTPYPEKITLAGTPPFAGQDKGGN